MTHLQKICAERSHPFGRQLQAEEQCDVTVVNSMLIVCCSTGGDGSRHRRQLQGGCSSFPPSCSPQCAAQFVPLYEGCPNFVGQIAGSGGEGFYARCSEAVARLAAMLMQPVQVRMYRISVSSSSEAAGNQAGMFLPGGGQTNPSTPPIIGPLPELPPSPANGEQGGGGSADVEQFNAQCTTANILTCVPTCNATTHGYELLATIDGTDTKFSCSLANLLYSWVGSASLGGFLGQNVLAFVSAVISGAAGTYVLTLPGDVDISVHLTIQPGQYVIITGGPSLTEAPAWGSGEFSVSSGAELILKDLEVSGPIAVASGGSLQLKHVDFAPGGCVRGDATLVDTPMPEICLLNVIFDGEDVDEFLASLGSGLPGTYVLRLSVPGAEVAVAALSVGPQQEVDVISTAAGSSLTWPRVRR